MYYGPEEYLRDLENLRDLLARVVEEFYSRVFGVCLNPKIEIYLVPMRYLWYNSKKIYVPFTYFVKLEENLRSRNLDEAIDSLSSLFHETVHYSFDTNKKDLEKYGIFTNEGLADVLRLFYLHTSKGVKIEDELTLDSLLFLINDKVIRGFLDKRKLKEIEKRIVEDGVLYINYAIALLNRVDRRKLLEELNEAYSKGTLEEDISRRLIYYIPAYLIIKEFGIEEYMSDLKNVILNPERKDEILKKYHEIIKNNYENIFLNSSAVSSGSLDITNSP